MTDANVELKKLTWRFVWGGLLMGLSQFQRDEVERVAKEYGSKTGEQRLLGLLRKKFDRESLLKLVDGARKKAELVVGYREKVESESEVKDLGSDSTDESLQPPPGLPLRQGEKNDGKSDFEERMTEVGKPLLSVYMTMSFVKEVMGEYLSASELELWQDKLGGDDLTEETMLELIELLEKRSGKGIDELVRASSLVASEQMAEDMVEAFGELVLIEKSGMGSKIAKAMEKGDVVGLASLYKKVSEIKENR